MTFQRYGPADSDPEADLLRAELMEIILWADSQSPRSLQKQLGPSEISSECPRSIAYLLSGIPEINDGADPWAAIVGTGIHMWLEEAVKSWALAHASRTWATEVTLPFTDLVRGHGDLFNIDRGWVVDHKSAGKDRMREVANQGPPQKYKTQVHLYGLGYELLGYPVRKVALAFYPRAGRLRDLVTWMEDYNPHEAFRALDQIPLLQTMMRGLDLARNPHRWEQIPHKPSHDCGYCPYYNFRRTAEQGASEEGCPGQ
jgi:PD-(D/E)XK nuclease superfamily protein